MRERLQEVQPRAGPAGAVSLTPSHSRLRSLCEEYAAYAPVRELVASYWHRVPDALDLAHFRAHGAYVVSRASRLRYVVTARYVRRRDPLRYCSSVVKTGRLDVPPRS